MILAIDPGTTQSGWVLMDGREVLASGVNVNEYVVGLVVGSGTSRLAIEYFEPRGMSVAQESIDTVFWSGRFAQASHKPEAVELIQRRRVKSHICGSQKANDANIRRAIIDLYGGDSAIGKKASPGPLYGVTSHAWQALAVALTAMEGST